MFSTSVTVDLAANTKTANLLSGDINEFTQTDSLINVYGVVSATNDIRMTVIADSDIAIDDKVIPFIGTTIDKSAHLVDSFRVFAGTRLAIFLRNTTATATTDIVVGVEVLPL